MDVKGILLTYAVSLNVLGLILMGIDKWRAKKKSYRISEAALFATALFGGALGCTIGMFLFRHKTRHWYFLVGMPLILALQLTIVIAILKSPIEFIIY